MEAAASGFDSKGFVRASGGKLELSIDGDLFKATVKMPLVYSCDGEQGSAQ